MGDRIALSDGHVVTVLARSGVVEGLTGESVDHHARTSSTTFMMTGWHQARVKKLSQDRLVYPLFDDGYTKMVGTNPAQAKCCSGPIRAFDPAKWENYHAVPANR